MAILLGHFMNSNYFVKGNLFLIFFYLKFLCSYVFKTFLKYTNTLHTHFTLIYHENLSFYFFLFLTESQNEIKVHKDGQ